MSDNWFSSYSQKCWGCFLRHSVNIQCTALAVRLVHVSLLGQFLARLTTNINYTKQDLTLCNL